MELIPRVALRNSSPVHARPLSGGGAPGFTWARHAPASEPTPLRSASPTGLRRGALRQEGTLARVAEAPARFAQRQPLERIDFRRVLRRKAALAVDLHVPVEDDLRRASREIGVAPREAAEAHLEAGLFLDLAQG